MDTKELIGTTGAAVATLQTLTERAEHYARRAKSANTDRAYGRNWETFSAWCDQHGLYPLPATPQTIAAYVSHLAATLKPSSIKLALAAIVHHHKMHGAPNPVEHPVVEAVIDGMKREHGTAQQTKKALVTEDLWRVLAHIRPDDPERKADVLRSARDKALLLLGFGGALRRSELVALDVEDLEISGRGITVQIRRSKTDQFGEGQTVGIHNRNAAVSNALKAWMELSGITTGPIFRNVDRHGRILERLSDHAVAEIVKHRIRAAGLDPANYSGHSLRSGLATSAANNGATEFSIRKQTRHKTAAMVHRYVQAVDVWRDNASEIAGL